MRKKPPPKITSIKSILIEIIEMDNPTSLPFDLR